MDFDLDREGCRREGPRIQPPRPIGCEAVGAVGGAWISALPRGLVWLKCAVKEWYRIQVGSKGLIPQPGLADGSETGFGDIGSSWIFGLWNMSIFKRLTIN